MEAAADHDERDAHRERHRGRDGAADRQPIAEPAARDHVSTRRDVVARLELAVADERSAGGVFDIAAPQVVSYLEIMQRFAVHSGVRRVFMGVPLFSPGLSRLWLSLVTGAPRALAGPLVESLRHEMTARDDTFARAAGLELTSFEDALVTAIADEQTLARDPFAYPSASDPQRSTVVSVQRMKLPPGRDAAWAAAEYPRWCARALGWLLRIVIEDDGTVRFRLRGLGLELLVLAPAATGNSSDRFLYRVAGGLLARDQQHGTLEVREIDDHGTILFSVRDFEPRLPWWIYRGTQSLAHAWIMHAFGRSLRRAR